MSERRGVVVVGSGAGGGVIAGELGARGHDVVLLEAGPHRLSRDFTRFELEAGRTMWFPPRFAMTSEQGPPIVMVSGRCVGGSTTINTKVALRAPEADFAKWHAAAGLLGDGGHPFATSDLAPYYDRVEAALGVRERADWPHSVRTVEPGFAAMETELEPVRSYTDFNCGKCGSCLQGCPTNAGKSTLSQWIQPGLGRGELELRAGCEVQRVLFAERDGAMSAVGVEYRDAAGDEHRLDADVVVVAAGTLSTPGLLLRSGMVEAAGRSASAQLVGHHLGCHTARMVHGLFAEPQDCHMVYPITARCDAFRDDAAGGFVVEATTIMDPIGLASNLVDDAGAPLWGERLASVMRGYRRWAGLFMMTNDSNNGTVGIDEDGRDTYAKPIPPEDQARLDQAHAFCADVLRAAGATDVVSTGYITSHVQGSCRMGSDPARSVVDAHGESHEIRRLFVGDASTVPSVLSVNPSLTVMALAARLADHIDADPAGYLTRRAAVAGA